MEEKESNSGLGKILLIFLAIAGLATFVGVISKGAKTAKIAKTVQVAHKAQDALHATKVVTNSERDISLVEVLGHASDGKTAFDVADKINTALEQQNNYESNKTSAAKQPLL